MVIWNGIQAKVSSSIQNFNLDRKYDAALAVRSEGFTERWGSVDGDGDFDDSWDVEEENIATICSLPHPSIPIVLHQYRPAWLEQLALRVANLPHIVVNSTYAVAEATGPLPFLQVLPTSDEKPALVGRYQIDLLGSSIIDYLQKHHNCDFDAALEGSKELRANADLLKTLVSTVLDPCLAFLRYSDSISWNQLYRKQSLRAGSGKSRGVGLFAVWQARGERLSALHSLPWTISSSSLDEVITRSREAYRVLDASLSIHEDGIPFTILGTSKPVTADLFVWNHLVQALTDVNLIKVLAEFPVILRYIQSIWDAYFDDGSSTAVEWRQWNYNCNVQNAFCLIPLIPEKFQTENLQNAALLMRQLSVTGYDLHESAQVAAASAPKKLYSSYNPFHTLHRWRMGDSIYPKTKERKHAGAAANKEEQVLQQEFHRNDQVWTATVVTVTLVSFFLVGLGQST